MNRPRVLMVLTRSFTDNPVSGRDKINSFIFSRISMNADVRVEQFRHFFITKNWFHFIQSILHFILHLCFKPYPLQALIFNDRREINRICSVIHSYSPDTVYVEGVRSYFLIARIRASNPNLYIVCDFDDLMSRRMQEWARLGNSISFGYIERHLPSLLRRFISGPMSGLICRYESISLGLAERELVEISSKIVLLSSKEVELFKSTIPESYKDKVCYIPPACDPLSIHEPKLPIRFVFIGSDTLLQNRLTIEYLINLWDCHKPNSPLHIYGKLNRIYANIPRNVLLCGFADSLEDVYNSNSVLLAPSFVKGGVKTKVLEALQFGTLTVGNSISFEGIMDIDNLPMLDNEKIMTEFIVNPQQHLDYYISQAQKIAAHVSKSQSTVVVDHLWNKCILPDCFQIANL